MTDIAKTMRPWLAERFVIGRPEVVEAQHSTDGTRKWLLRTADGHDFEMVFIPDETTSGNEGDDVDLEEIDRFEDFVGTSSCRDEKRIVVTDFDRKRCRQRIVRLRVLRRQRPRR